MKVVGPALPTGLRPCFDWKRETLASNGLVHDALLHEFKEIFAGRGLEPLPDPRVHNR